MKRKSLQDATIESSRPRHGFQSWASIAVDGFERVAKVEKVTLRYVARWRVRSLNMDTPSEEDFNGVQEVSQGCLAKIL